ncbi:bifunctional phosphopantothenoylcysteine decarboxylase/phosphopantothenate--cysteine ligase CoaBC [Lactobacillus sp.]|uniref:bifunctional phosphopantothenoylcysteine decarboxylase/phosphopantothenate--cysteine ligase CoaBC n=1 Tax=Lactobacillus sp. TaxID=1591 RepID=UPI003EF96492
MARIAVYLTGGIAAYKAVSVVRGLQKAGHEVHVAMTKNSEQFVGKATLASLTKHPVLDDLFAKEVQASVAHIDLADWSDLALVVPADANIIGKMANGIADDAVSTTLLASTGPRLIVPAMNSHMWANPAVQRNLAYLTEQGDEILEPATGYLAEGYSGKGRMPEPEVILAWVDQHFDRPLLGKKIMITAGGTKEAIDPVRYIGNHSSGKMGLALAKRAAQMGAQVALVYGNISVPVPKNSQISLYPVGDAAEMLAQVERLFPDSDALIMAAAVGDWRVKEKADHKLKKQPGVDELTLHLVKNPDILKNVAAQKDRQVVIGFAAETNDLLANAERKLREKGADFIVANDVSGDAFGGDYDQVTILEKEQDPVTWPRMTKDQVAKKLLTLLANRLEKPVRE